MTIIRMLWRAVPNPSVRLQAACRQFDQLNTSSRKPLLNSHLRPERNTENTKPDKGIWFCIAQFTKRTIVCVPTEAPRLLRSVNRSSIHDLPPRNGRRWNILNRFKEAANANFGSVILRSAFAHKRYRAMSTREQAIAKLGEVLIKRRDALRQALAGDLSALMELRAQSSGDLVDHALDAAQDEISSQLAEVESRELAQIANAIEQMRQGTYGICEVSGKPIPLARLQALPYATMCIEAQREIEKNGGAPRSPADWSRVLDSDSPDNEVTFNDIEIA